MSRLFVFAMNRVLFTVRTRAVAVSAACVLLTAASTATTFARRMLAMTAFTTATTGMLTAAFMRTAMLMSSFRTRPALVPTTVLRLSSRFATTDRLSPRRAFRTRTALATARPTLTPAPLIATAAAA